MTIVHHLYRLLHQPVKIPITSSQFSRVGFREVRRPFIVSNWSSAITYTIPGTALCFVLLNLGKPIADPVLAKVKALFLIL
jgi:hypothetical protein